EEEPPSTITSNISDHVLAGRCPRLTQFYLLLLFCVIKLDATVAVRTRKQRAYVAYTTARGFIPWHTTQAACATPAAPAESVAHPSAAPRSADPPVQTDC